LVRNVFHHDRCAGDGGRYRAGVNPRAAKTFRHLEQHRAFLQREVTRSCFEAEERLGAEPRQRVVLEEQLGA
jgi:hypothetical protein